MENKPETSKEDSESSSSEIPVNDANDKKTPKDEFKVPSENLESTSEKSVTAKENEASVLGSSKKSDFETILNTEDVNEYEKEYKKSKDPQSVTFKSDEDPVDNIKSVLQTPDVAEKSPKPYMNDPEDRNSQLLQSPESLLSEVSKANDELSFQERTNTIMENKSETYKEDSESPSEVNDVNDQKIPKKEVPREFLKSSPEENITAEKDKDSVLSAFKKFDFETLLNTEDVIEYKEHKKLKDQRRVTFRSEEDIIDNAKNALKTSDAAEKLSKSYLNDSESQSSENLHFSENSLSEVPKDADKEEKSLLESQEMIAEKVKSTNDNKASSLITDQYASPFQKEKSSIAYFKEKMEERESRASRKVYSDDDLLKVRMLTDETLSDSQKILPQTSAISEDISEKQIDQLTMQDEHYKRSPIDEFENTTKEKEFDIMAPQKQNDNIPKENSKEQTKSVFVSKKSVDENSEKDLEIRKKVKRRPSFLRRKIIALEDELTMENISKATERIFAPVWPGTDSDLVSKNAEKYQRHYISSSMATIFLISIITGSVFTSLPYFLSMSNWFGVFILILLGLNSLYAGLCIGWSWLILEELWPEYLGYSRIPYQDIAYRAGGNFLKYVVAITVDVCVLGTSVVYIILTAREIEKLIDSLSFCYLLVIVTAVLLPMTMFGSYRNIMLIGIFDVTLSILFAFFMIVSLFLDKPNHGVKEYDDGNFDTLLISFSGFSFAYGSGPPLSNIIVDMKDRTMFTHSCATAFMVCIIIYTLLSIMGYAAYGDDTPPSITAMVLKNEDYRPMGILIDIVYILQIMTTFICYLFPSLHAFESRVNCPDRFCLCRVTLRFIIVASMLFFILGVPYISGYLQLASVISMNMTTFIFPPVCYVCLVYQQPRKSRWNITKKEWIFIIETVVMGVVVTVTSTITRLKIINASSQNKMSSCYSNMTQASSFHAWETILKKVY